MNIMKQTRGLFGETDVWKTNEWLLGLVCLLTSCFSISVVPFIRKDLGERYFGWLNLYFGYSVVAGFMFFGNIVGALTRHAGGSRLMSLFWLGFIGMSLYRRYEISRKNKAGLEWHSMSIGISILPLPFSREQIFKIYEPLTVFVAGLLLWKFSGQAGLWLMMSAFCLLINNQIVFYRERQTFLDARDGQIEAKYLSAALAGKPAQETAGFIVSESSAKLMGGDASLVTAFSNLPAELKSMLDSSADLAAVQARAEGKEPVTDHVSR